VASSRESELPNTRKHHSNIQVLGKAWVLRSEITTNLLHDDMSMDCDGDEDAKAQNTEFPLEAALDVKFESLLGKMLISGARCCRGAGRRCGPPPRGGSQAPPQAAADPPPPPAAAWDGIRCAWPRSGGGLCEAGAGVDASLWRCASAAGTVRATVKRSDLLLAQILSCARIAGRWNLFHYEGCLGNNEIVCSR
jgi:hypothetical protein